MKRTFVTLGIAAAAVFAARADNTPELNTRHHFPDKAHDAKPGGGAKPNSNLVNHGGPVIAAPRVVAIFWGPSWNTGGADNATAKHIEAFFGQFATSSHLDMLPQYSNAASQAPSNMLSHSVYDTSTPPTNVTDAAVQAEVLKALNGAAPDSSTIYEVFLPPSSYSSDGTSTSCGGPHLAYCAYHGHFSNGGHDIKYSSMPYPSCGGCISNSSWTAGQNIDHFSCHETREAITDEDLNAWYDRRGNEADDKCAWSPNPFLDGQYGYQYEWSNAAGGCVK
ncbi:MAG: hypothetical protein ABR567_15310 [Myxococcales bacterium]|nr:hypothetical protein [Myxococcales bacterium]